MRTTLLCLVVVCLGALLVSAASANQPALPDPAGDLKLSDSSMQIPWADFQEILKKLTAAQAPLPQAPPPVDAVVSSADYSVVVNDDRVLVTIAAQILVLKEDGWATAPIIRSGVPLKTVRLDDEPTILTTKNDGLLYLIVEGPGRHMLRLSIELMLTKNSGPDQFVLPTINAPVNQLQIKADRPDLLFNLSSGGSLSSKTVAGSTIAGGSFPPTDPLTVSWTRKVPKAARETARVSAEVRTMLTVGEGLGVYTTIIDYDIQHKPISSFSMLLPKQVNVADVSTEGLVDWNVKPQGDEQKLTVLIAFEAIGRHSVAVTYEAALPAKDEITFKTAELVVQDVVHELGFLAVAVRTNIQVDPKEGSLKNLAQIDPNELPPDLRGLGDQKVLTGFKYIKHPSSLELTVIKHKDASVLTCEVETAEVKMLLLDNGKQLIEADYRIANRSLQYLGLTLPEGSDLWGVYRDGQPVKAAESQGQILLPIFQKQQGKLVNIKIIAYRKTNPWKLFGHRQIELPSLDVGTNKAYLQLFLPDRFRPYHFDGTLRRTYRDTDYGLVDELSSSETPQVAIGHSGKPPEDFYLDKGSNEWNLNYRDQQSRIQSNIENIPVASVNPIYDNAMSRGALPVQFQIDWSGAHHNFSATIIDPEEKAAVSFWFFKRSHGGLLWIVILFLSAWIAYFGVSLILLCRKNKDLPLPKSQLLIWALALLILLALSSIYGRAFLPVIAGLASGALGGLAKGMSSDISDNQSQSTTANYTTPTADTTEKTATAADEDKTGDES